MGLIHLLRTYNLRAVESPSLERPGRQLHQQRPGETRLGYRQALTPPRAAETLQGRHQGTLHAGHLGLRSGFEPSGLDRPGRLPQQGLCEARLGYQDEFTRQTTFETGACDSLGQLRLICNSPLIILNFFGSPRDMPARPCQRTPWRERPWWGS